MIKNILIFGSGGHAKVIADEISNYKNIKVAGYIDSIKNNEVSIKKIKFKVRNKNIYNSK